MALVVLSPAGPVLVVCIDGEGRAVVNTYNEDWRGKRTRPK
jgi:hypothetical protein